MKLSEELNQLIKEAAGIDMTQCVIKVEDIGNEFEFKGIIEEGSNYESEWDMQTEYSDRLEIEEPRIEFWLAYHPGELWDGTKLYDELGIAYDLDYDKYNADKEAMKADEIQLNKEATVIPDAAMIESLNETYEKFNVEGVDFAFQDRPDGLVQITQIRPYSMQNWSWAIGKLDPRENKDASFGLYKVNRDNKDKVDTLITVRDSKEEVAKWMLRKDKDLEYLADRT